MRLICRLRKPVSLAQLRKHPGLRNAGFICSQVRIGQDISDDWPLIRGIILTNNPDVRRHLRPIAQVRDKKAETTYWRMAMREGNRGFDTFEQCREAGIAGIGYGDENGRDLVGDCRKLSRESFDGIWRRKAPRNSTGRSSLGHVAYDMRVGDVIYVKDGPEIEGKGVVVGEYIYSPRGVTSAKWCHYVNVRWDKEFTSFECPLGAEPTTVLKLDHRRLAILTRAERKANGRGKAPSRAVAIELDALPEDLAALEGQARRVMVTHRQREHRLRAAKIRQAMGLNGGRLQCAVPGCGFDFVETYGHLGRDFAFVHHLRGLAAKGKPSETRLEDLAIVCGNCHAMIHRNGKCRDLGGLIQRKGRSH